MYMTEIDKLLIVIFSYYLNVYNFCLQVILHSQVKATLTINDAWLELQDGFVHTGQGDGRPTSSFFPLVIPPTSPTCFSKAGILFSIGLGKMTEGMNFFFC